jgi:hypothetical protein
VAVQRKKHPATQFLRLVEKGEDLSPPPADSVRNAARSARILQAEADAIEARYGTNAYTDFLRKHGVRPTREQAVCIGRLLGGRVRADDGSMQPPLTKADRAEIRAIKARSDAWAHQSTHIYRIENAVTEICANMDSPAAVAKYAQAWLKDETNREQLAFALSWLIRFAEESGIYEHEKSKSAGS